MRREQTSAQELQEAALDRSLMTRRTLLTDVSNLFEGRPNAFTDREETLFNGILSHLISEFESNLRRSLAEQLSGRSDAPRDLVLSLADETVEIARPALVIREVRGAEPLIEAVFFRMMAHQVAGALESFSGPASSESAQPVAAEQEDTVRLLLNRPEPQIADAAKAYLIRDANRLDSFQDPILRPEDLEPAQVRGLLWRIAALLRHHVLSHFDIETYLVDEGLEAATLELTGRAEAAAADQPPEPAEDLADHLLSIDKLGTEALEGILRQGETALFEALFARLLAVPPRRARRILYESEDKDLAIACRALDMTAAQFVVLRGLLWRGRPSAGGETSDARMQASEAYEAIEPEDARHVRRFWQRDSRYLEAIEQIEGAASNLSSE